MKNKRNVRKLQCFIAFLIIIIFTAFYEYFKFNEEGKTICIALECPKGFHWIIPKSLYYFKYII